MCWRLYGTTFCRALNPTCGCFRIAWNATTTSATRPEFDERDTAKDRAAMSNLGAGLEDAPETNSTTVSTQTLTKEKNALTLIDISSDSGDDLSDRVASNGARVSSGPDAESAWETDSFYEDIIDELEDYQYAGGAF